MQGQLITRFRMSLKIKHFVKVSRIQSWNKQFFVNPENPGISIWRKKMRKLRKNCYRDKDALTTYLTQMHYFSSF